MNRIFAIGDIHGCADKLKPLMETIPIDPVNDTLIFIGDYVDRGPNSFEVVDYLVDLKKRYPGTVFLKGNHEDMLQKYLEGTDRFTYLFNGGQRTLDSYLNRSHKTEHYPIPADHLEFYRSLVLYYQTDDFLFVHAGLRENVPLHKQEPDELLWIRDEFIYSTHDFGRRVVFGHTPFAEPLVMSNKIGIDTGAVYGNQLTCVQLPEIIFFAV